MKAKASRLRPQKRRFRGAKLQVTKGGQWRRHEMGATHELPEEESETGDCIFFMRKTEICENEKEIERDLE